MNRSILLAGFGGQGILFAGKFLAYCGLLSGANVSWLPSYGPEMRGGTANCGVVLSDVPVGSPIVLKPDVLVAMNAPSYDKFEPAAVPGAKVFVDNSLITRKANRADVDTFYVPATKIAEERGFQGLANMILLGKLIAELKLFPDDITEAAMVKVVSARKSDLISKNAEALKTGANSGE